MPVKHKPADTPAAETISTACEVEQRPISRLKPYENTTRRHGETSIARLAASIRQFGFVLPVLVDRQGVIICGHGRVQAAQRLGLKAVPVVTAEHLSEAQVRALRIADNKLAELSEWNEAALRIELGDLAELDLAGALDFDLTITGFDMPEIDLIIEGGDAKAAAETVEEPDAAAPVVSRPGDLWQLGRHRLLCADALQAASYAALLGRETAGMIFTDPPYNVPVQGHVRGGGGHRDFAMASGEMTPPEFRAFLRRFLEEATAKLVPGGIAMVCMDWRHIHELILAGQEAGCALINLCVWNKTNGGMGSLYRSKHELVCVFKKPGAAHINNVELGRHGRYRTNVWDYAGVNSFGAGRDADLADHPTVKPTPLVADAILDVSRRGDLVLDSFGGSGATLLAAEKTGRKARLIELDPAYVDVAIRRWEATTGGSAILAATGETFAERAARGAATEPEEVSHVEA